MPVFGKHYGWYIFEQDLCVTLELIGIGQYQNSCGPISEPSTAVTGRYMVPNIAALISVPMKLNIFTIPTRALPNTKWTSMCVFFLF